jgi:hypothetical protein
MRTLCSTHFNPILISRLLRMRIFKCIVYYTTCKQTEIWKIEEVFPVQAVEDLRVATG